MRRGFEVVVLDDLSSGKRENLAPYLDDIEFVRGDVRDRDLVFQVTKGAELVFHHAAITAVPLTVDDPFLSAEVNGLGTLNVFMAARAAGVRRVVYASSSAVYGNSNRLPHSEALTLEPGSPYAVHKLLGEHYGAMFDDLYGLEVVSLRYFNVFGPRQDPSSPCSGVVSIFFQALDQGQRPVVFGDGGQSRDFIFIRDAGAAAFLAGEAVGAAGQVYNIGTGRAVTLNRMLEVMADLTGTRIDPIIKPPRPGDVYASKADVAKARDELGFQAQVPLRSGLALTWEWFKDRTGAGE